MSKDTATALLREQHRLILKVVGAFERAMSKDVVLPPARDIEAFITFFRLFTDACHHGKEEDLLFAAMEDQGMGGEGGPIDAMRAEHRIGRSLVRAMNDAAPKLSTAEARSAFRLSAAAYVDFIRGHIAREDDGLFEAADARIDGPACAALCDAYEAVCSRRFEGLSIAQLERMAEELIESYPAGGPRVAQA
jgi:hemerythrin-like domain-containing protein